MDTFTIGQTVGSPQNGDIGQVQDIWWHGSLLVQFLTVWVERSRTTYEWNSRYVIDASTPYLPGGDAGMFPAAHPRPILDAEYSVWLDTLAANQALEEDPIYFRDYVEDVEACEDAHNFYRALTRLENAIADWRDAR